MSRIAFAVDARAGATRRARVAEHGSLRVRFPGPYPLPSLSRLRGRDGEGAELEAVIVNIGGGVAGGDRLDIEVAVGPGARLVVTTAAAEKIYRTLEPDATIDIRLAVGAGAELAWLPQETILFDRARLSRSIEIDLAPDSRLVLAEAIVFGRTGMGEVVDDGCLFDRWRLRRDGMLIHAEATRLDGAVARRLAEPAVANGAVALATVLVAPADESVAAGLRLLTDRFRGEVGISAWKELAVVRLCASDAAALRHDLVGVLSSVRGKPLPRLWSN